MRNSWLDRELISRKLIFVTGKGGIGKTLIAAAMTLRARQLGRRVLVIEQSAVDQLGPLLGFKDVGHNELWTENLGVANFTAMGNFRDFISKHLMKSHLFDVLISNTLVHSFFTAIPGFKELMLLGRIYYALNLAPTKPDLIIVDAYASGHFLSLMSTPEAVLSSGLAGPIAVQTKKVQEWLSDHEQCVTIFVATPEDLVISETIEFISVLLKRSPVKVQGIIMNRYFSGSYSRGDTEPTLIDRFLINKIDAQQKAMKKFHKAVSGDEVLKAMPILELRDLGAIEEPLNDKTLADLFSGERNHG
jgi:arsenite/tail-anchored protein-transporting ATPase